MARFRLKPGFPAGMLFLLLVSSCQYLDFGAFMTPAKHSIPLMEKQGEYQGKGSVRLRSGGWILMFSEYGARSNESVIFHMHSGGWQKTWSDADTLLRVRGRCSAPFVHQLSDQLVVLLFGVEGQIAVPEGPSFRTRIVFSYDQGNQFTTPKPVQCSDIKTLTPLNHLVETKSGHWIFPAIGWPDSGDAALMAIVSTDRGESWQASMIQKTGTPELSRIHLSLTQMNSGDILGLLKTAGDPRIYQIRSKDNGLHWSVPQMTGMVGSSPDVRCLDNHALLCSYADESPRGISIRMSYDGISWEAEKPLLSGTFSEPELIRMASGQTAVVCSNINEDACAIRASLFTDPALSVPEGISVSIKNGIHHLRWNEMENAKYYLIFRDKTSDFYADSTSLIAMPISNQFLDRDATREKIYYYRIAACRATGVLSFDMGGIGPASEPVVFEP